MKAELKVTISCQASNLDTTMDDHSFVHGIYERLLKAEVEMNKCNIRFHVKDTELKIIEENSERWQEKQ